MKKYIIWLIPIAIIATFLGMLLSPSHNNASYRFSGELEDGLNSIQVQVFLIQNNEGNLLNYYTDIYNSEEEIKGAQIYYLENALIPLSNPGCNSKSSSRRLIEHILNKDPISSC